MGYKTEIKVYNDPKYYPNGVTFTTEEEGIAYGRMKLATWMLAEGYRVVASDEPPNYRYADNGIVSLEPHTADVQ